MPRGGEASTSNVHRLHDSIAVVFGGAGVKGPARPDMSRRVADDARMRVLPVIIGPPLAH
jgi:hypothetical protein